MSSASISTLLAGDVGRKIGMHVVAASPLYLQPSEVPADIVERETAISRYISYIYIYTDTFKIIYIYTQHFIHIIYLYIHSNMTRMAVIRLLS